MTGPHGHTLYFHGHSPVHRLAPETKLVAQLAFVLIVVATPREAFWAFAVYFASVLLVGALARIPLRYLLKRLVFEVPFVAFAFLLPFIGRGEQVDVFGLSLSVDGLWGAWNILAKATIGLLASVVVASTTTMAEFLTGFDRLRVPQAFTSIASFMVRYLDVIADEMRRMRIARISRGYEARWIWQAKAIAQTAGALFVRSYERGERVYLAMVSRGYEGHMPEFGEPAATGAMWAAALTPVVLAAAVCVAAWIGVSG